MKYKVTKGCVIGGKPCKAGDVVDITDAQELKILMGIGRVLPHDEPVIEDRAIGLAEDTKPRKRGRPKKVHLDG